MPQRKVSVINHYAFPPGSGGITRNFDMFSRLRGWQPHFYAANINHTSGERMTVDDPRYTLVPIPSTRATESSGSSAGLPLPPAPEPAP